MAYNMLYETYVGADDYSLSLKHHGIKGQKWGVRRFQNPDGSYTDAGRKRRGLTGESRERRGLSDKQKTMIKRGAAVAATAAAVGASVYLAKKYNLNSGVMKHSVKEIARMSDEALTEKIGRLEKEKRLYDLEREISSNSKTNARKAIEKAGKQTVETMTAAAALYGAKQGVKKYVNSRGSDGDRVLREMFPKKK